MQTNNFDSDEEMYGAPVQQPAPISQAVGRKSSRSSHPRAPPTPGTSVPPSLSHSNPLLQSAPASPPTPAPSPTPHTRSLQWHKSSMGLDASVLRDFLHVLGRLEKESRESWLTSLVDSCGSQDLSFMHELISPRMKKDPFQVLPNELCFKVLSCPVCVDRSFS